MVYIDPEHADNPFLQEMLQAWATLRTDQGPRSPDDRFQVLGLAVAAAPDEEAARRIGQDIVQLFYDEVLWPLEGLGEGTADKVVASNNTPLLKCVWEMYKAGYKGSSPEKHEVLHLAWAAYACLKSTPEIAEWAVSRLYDHWHEHDGRLDGEDTLIKLLRVLMNPQGTFDELRQAIEGLVYMHMRETGGLGKDF
jgi:hypothetical protein